MESLELWNPATFKNGFPHDYFRHKRDNDPVFWCEHPVWGGFWNVTRHADVQRVSRDSDCFKNQPNPFLAGDQPPAVDDGSNSQMLISLDPPDHTKMRKLVNRGFTPRRVRDLEVRIQSQVDRLIDQVSDKTSCEMVSEIAVELPLQVIADLVGVPEEDRHGRSRSSNVRLCRSDVRDPQEGTSRRPHQRADGSRNRRRVTRPNAD